MIHYYCIYSTFNHYSTRYSTSFVTFVVDDVIWGIYLQSLWYLRILTDIGIDVLVTIQLFSDPLFMMTDWSDDDWHIVQYSLTGIRIYSVICWWWPLFVDDTSLFIHSLTDILRDICSIYSDSLTVDSFWWPFCYSVMEAIRWPVTCWYCWWYWWPILLDSHRWYIHLLILIFRYYIVTVNHWCCQYCCYSLMTFIHCYLFDSVIVIVNDRWLDTVTKYSDILLLLFYWWLILVFSILNLNDLIIDIIDD